VQFINGLSRDKNLIFCLNFRHFLTLGTYIFDYGPFTASPDLRHLVQTFIFKNISCYFHTLIFFLSELEIVFLSEIPTL